jgi:hypothetical protein
VARIRTQTASGKPTTLRALSSPPVTSTAGRCSCRPPGWKAGSQPLTPSWDPPGTPPYEVVPSGSFTDPEYGRVGLTGTQAAQHHDTIVGIARYDDLLRPVADGRSEGFCKVIADRRTHAILGAHVLGEYSAETVQTVAACMAAGMTIGQVAELQLAFPTFTEAVSMAAQKICRTLGIGRFPQVWSYLGSED